MTDPPTTTVRRREGTRGQRYGEMFVVRAAGEGAGLSAEVYNTYPLNECPQAEWDALDLGAIAAARGALLAVANGPRYWLIDWVEKAGPATPVVETFGGIDMARVATLDLGAGFDPSPFTERQVERAAKFGWRAGRAVYELTAPDGAVYVMQSWCVSEDAGLGEADLAGLGALVGRPEGWAYAGRTLDADLVVDTTTGTARVIQDALRNTYCRRN